MTRKKETIVESPLKIVLFVLGFTFLFSAMTVFIKLTTLENIPIFTIMFFRFLFGAIPITILLGRERKIKQELFHAQWKDLTLRSVMGMLAMWCVFQSFKMLPVAEATLLHFASPFFLTLLSIYFLGEHVGRWRWGAIIAGFIGVCFVLRPEFSGAFYGQVIALCAAIIMAMNMTMVRSLTNTVSPQAMTIYVHVVGIICTLPLALYEGVLPHDGHAWFYLLAAGLCAGTAQILLNKAFMGAPPAYVSSFSYIQIIFVTLAGVFVFGDPLSHNFIIGAGIITTAGVTIALREYLLNRKTLLKDII